MRLARSHEETNGAGVPVLKELKLVLTNRRDLDALGGTGGAGTRGDDPAVAGSDAGDGVQVGLDRRGAVVGNGERGCRG